MAERRYDDEEVGRVLRAAAEMQSGRELSGEGATLGELQRIAQEVGIDPENVRRAAREIDLKRAPTDGKDSLFIERTIPGDLSDEAWNELVEEMRRFSGRPGKEEGREWTDWGEFGGTSLTATPRRGQTQLRLLGSIGGMNALIGTLTFAFLFLFIPLTAALSHRALGPLFTTLLSVAIGLIAIGTAVRASRVQRRNFRSQLETLSERIENIASADREPDRLGIAIPSDAETVETTV